MANKIKGIAVPMVFDITGYPAASEDNRCLHDSIFTILNTTPGERVMRPTFGCWLRRIIHENLDVVSAVMAEVEIRRALRDWEPRITVTNVLLEISDTDSSIIASIDWVASGEDGVTVFAVGI